MTQWLPIGHNQEWLPKGHNQEWLPFHILPRSYPLHYYTGMALGVGPQVCSVALNSFKYERFFTKGIAEIC